MSVLSTLAVVSMQYRIYQCGACGAVGEGNVILSGLPISLRHACPTAYSGVYAQVTTGRCRHRWEWVGAGWCWLEGRPALKYGYWVNDPSLHRLLGLRDRRRVRALLSAHPPCRPWDRARPLLDALAELPEAASAAEAERWWHQHQHLIPRRSSQARRVSK